MNNEDTSKNHSDSSNHNIQQPIVVITNVSGTQVIPQNIGAAENRAQFTQSLSHGQNPNQQPQLQTNIDDGAGYTWREYNRKNRRQAHAITSGCMIISGSTIHLGSIYFYLQLFLYFYEPKILHLMISWFVGVIIGAIISTIFVRNFRKIIFNYVGSILTMASGIMSVTLSGNLNAIITVQYLGGIAHGLVIIPILMHAGEISVKRLRGSIMSNIHICFTIGILTGIIFYGIFETSKSNVLDIHQLSGIGIIIFGIIGFLYNMCMTIESPLYLIDKQNHDEAFTAFLQLRSEKYETLYQRQQFNDLKEMYDEDMAYSASPFNQGNLKPLLIITAIRIQYILLTSIPVYLLFILNIQQSMSTGSSVSLIIIARLIGEIVSWILIDRKGRTIILQISLFLSGVCIIIVGILYNQNVSITVASFFYQICLGFGVGTSSLTYMSETFPFIKKPNSLLLIVICEHLLHIIIIVIMANDFINFNYLCYFCIVGVFGIIMSALKRFLPETVNLTLRQCRNAMR